MSFHHAGTYRFVHPVSTLSAVMALATTTEHTRRTIGLVGLPAPEIS